MVSVARWTWVVMFVAASGLVRAQDSGHVVRSGHSIFMESIDGDDGWSPATSTSASRRMSSDVAQATFESSRSGPSIIQVGMHPATGSPDQTWVLVAPYVWTPAMKGRIGARGVSVPIDMSLSDLYDILFDDLNGAVMGHVEVGKGNFGLIFDGMLMRVSPSQTGPLGGRLDFDISSTILESMAMARVVDVELDAATNARWSVDLLGGARYYQVQNGVRINPVNGPTVSADLSKDWVDLVIGARTAVTLVPGLDGFARTDFGGFGIGTSSQLAWNLITGVSWECQSHPGTSLVLGYRVLDINESQGSGDQQFRFDVTMQGPFAAFSFAF